MASRVLTPIRARLRAQDGFGIIEVLVSALMVILISLALFAAIDAAGRTADSNRDRSAASNIAQADQERMRGMTVADLTGLNQVDRLVSAGLQTYKVTSTANYVLGTASSAQCSSDDNAPRYFQINSTVRWDDMRNIEPVEEHSLRAIPSGTTADKGSAAISIVDRSGTGVPNIPVTLTGGVTQTVNTNAKGCAIFGFVPAGSYTTSFNQAGYVEAPYPNRQAVSEPITVSSNSIATKSFQYDRAGTIAVSYDTTTTAGTATPTTTTITGGTANREFTIANAALGATSSKLYNNVLTTGATVFPFTGAYAVYAGDCAGASSPSQSASVTPGNTNNVTLRLPKLRFQANRKTSTNTTQVIPNGTPASLISTGSGCSQVFTSTVTGGYVTFDAPYGQYSLCLNYATPVTVAGLLKVANSQTTTGFASDAAAGKAFNNTGTPTPIVPIVPFLTGTNVNACPTT